MKSPRRGRRSRRSRSSAARLLVFVATTFLGLFVKFAARPGNTTRGVSTPTNGAAAGAAPASFPSTVNLSVLSTVSHSPSGLMSLGGARLPLDLMEFTPVGDPVTLCGRHRVADVAVRRAAVPSQDRCDGAVADGGRIARIGEAAGVDRVVDRPASRPGHVVRVDAVRMRDAIVPGAAGRSGSGSARTSTLGSGRCRRGSGLERELGDAVDSVPLKEAFASIQNASPVGSKFAVLTGASGPAGIDEQFAVPSVQRPTDRPSAESVNDAGSVVFGSFADAVTVAPAGTAVIAAAAPTTTAIVIAARVRLRARRAPSLAY